jgi:hypothetical protein
MSRIVRRGTGTTHRDTVEVFISPPKVPLEVEVNLRPTVGRPICLGVGLPSGGHDQIFVFCQTIAVPWHEAPSLMRGWVCSLLVQLLLGLARAVILRSKHRRTYGHILLPHMRLLQPGGPGPHIYIPQEQGGTVIWSPQPRGPGPHIYIPQEQGDPVTSQGNGLPFHCLLRLTELWWRYSNPPPQGIKKCLWSWT